MTLLCPLARALHTNVNALLAFEQTMTREQLTAFSEAFVQLVRGDRRQTALDDMERLLAEYPGDTALRLNCAALMNVVEVSFPDESEPIKAAWREKRRALYEEAALSEEADQRESAVCALAAMDLSEDKLDAAQRRLDSLPEHSEDTTLLRVQLLKKRGEMDRALEVTQKQLYRAVSKTLERLTLLMDVQTETPMCTATTKVIAGRKLAFVPILRAGLGMVDGMLQLVPSAKVGHIGLYRDHDTLQPVEYYNKLPSDIEERDVIVLDPMLATGGSAMDAITIVKRSRPRSIKFLCIIAAPEGLKALSEAHPDVHIYCAAVDEKLNEHGYILPGLGDAGDRIFGTM